MKDICSINGTIQPIDKATISLADIESQYNFGVYETIKVRNSVVYFVTQHINRLFHSAQIINLEHQFVSSQIESYIQAFAEELQEESSNLKILLYGGSTKEEAKLIILASAPFYPNRKWYKEGVTMTSFEYERWMPQAKTLNMLPSYYYYKKAKQQTAYDALLIDRQGNMLEGTRTNIYLLKGKTIYSPPKKVILEGVTLMSLEKIIEGSEYTMQFQELPFDSIVNYDGMFLSSTSSKILPVRQVNDFRFEEIAPEITELVKLYDTALTLSNGDFMKL